MPEPPRGRQTPDWCAKICHASISPPPGSSGPVPDCAANHPSAALSRSVPDLPRVPQPRMVGGSR